MFLPQGQGRALLLGHLALPVALAEKHFSAWSNPRAAIIQDLIAIEGGMLYQTDFENGNWSGSASQVRPDKGLLYTVNLCNPFSSTTTQADEILVHEEETQIADYHIYFGGGMLATDYGFYTYGGLSMPDSENSTLGVTYGALYPSNDAIQIFNPGFNTDWHEDISIDSIQTHRAFGAWASAPSESLGFWFGGLEAVDGGPINVQSSLDTNDVANKTSNVIVKVDMSEPNQAKWSEQGLPSEVVSRAEGALVWLPFGNQGILLAFGGVAVPGDMDNQNSSLSNSTLDAAFMTNIAVYDVHGGTWSLQPTLESNPRPTARAQFCTAVTSAQDNSSSFIYVYGGYDGQDSYSTIMDEMWVLSVPAFEWTLLDRGYNTSHGRMGHICVSADPTQMISIGGTIGGGQNLLNNDLIDVYNFSTAQWTHQYDPTSTALYDVPSTITEQIGGHSKGGFEVPSNLEDSVKSLVSSVYPYSQKIKAYYPRPDCGTNTTTPAPTPAPTTTPTPNATPTWQTPVIASVAVIVGLVIVMTFVWCVWLRKPRNTESGTASKRWSIVSWRNKTHPPAPPQSEGSQDTAVATPVDYFGVKNVNSGTYEMPSNVTSPGYSAFSHGSPQLVSPNSPLSGSVEVEARNPYEIMDNPGSQRESMSIRNHPYYPRSIAGTHILSARTESISHPSENLIALRSHGHVSPYELAQDRSNENLSPPPEDNVLEHQPRQPFSELPSRSFGIEEGQIQTPTLVTSLAGVARKPLNPNRRVSSPVQSPPGIDRPSHQRNQSSISSNIPHIPSPGPEENQRMSRHIDALPDVDGYSNTCTQRYQQESRQETGPVRSAYQENFDNAGNVINTWPQR